MTKIMLVEDDNNLREIYEARLLAEGYEIVSARDGEEALALAVKEKPDLIISDIMMPKISGFDMLDILRSTPETHDTKVIMMTALGQTEDKNRADKLGADRYLVKSQVTLEDVARTAREVLGGKETSPNPAATGMAPGLTTSPTGASAPSETASTTADKEAKVTADAPASMHESSTIATPPSSDIPAAAQMATPPANPEVSAPSAPAAGSTTIDPTLAASLAEEEKELDQQIQEFEKQPTVTPEPVAAETPSAQPEATSAPAVQRIMVKELSEQPKEGEDEAVMVEPTVAPTPDTEPSDANDGPTVGSPHDLAGDDASSNNVPIANKKVIKPINDLHNIKKPDLEALAAKEDAGSAPASSVISSPATPPVNTVIQPGGAMVSSDGPASSSAVSPGTPGAVINPLGGGDPNNIAL